MNDQWSGAENDINRLRDLPGSTDTGAASNAGMGTGATGARPTSAATELGSADMNGTQPPGGKVDKAKEALSGMQEKAGELGSQASSKADAGMDKAASGLDSLASIVRERGESMGEGQVGSLATAAADRMHAGAEMIRGTDADQLMTDLEALIRRRPVESLLVAAGVGYLISRAR